MKSPHFVAASSSCASILGLDTSALSTDDFVSLFSGNALLEGFDTPWATVYGCHCYGQWFGQLGDGRAMSIGEVLVDEKKHCDVINDKDGDTVSGEILSDNSLIKKRYELQLKGCGRTPYSRGFDGRAVLRSCVRLEGRNL